MHCVFFACCYYMSDGYVNIMVKCDVVLLSTAIDNILYITLISQRCEQTKLTTNIQYYGNFKIKIQVKYIVVKHVKIQKFRDVKMKIKIVYLVYDVNAPP